MQSNQALPLFFIDNKLQKQILSCAYLEKFQVPEIPYICI